MKNKKKISRRSFIANTAIAGIGAISVSNLISSCTDNKPQVSEKNRNTYTGKQLDRIAFPVDGRDADEKESEKCSGPNCSCKDPFYKP